MQHAFPSFSAARKVSSAFFYPDTCPWFIELSHSAIQLHTSYFQNLVFSCPRLKRKVGNEELSGMGSQSFPVARHDVRNNYFSSNLGIACGPRQYPRQFSNLDILMDFDASNITLVVE